MTRAQRARITNNGCAVRKHNESSHISIVTSNPAHFHGCALKFARISERLRVAHLRAAHPSQRMGARYLSLTMGAR